MYRSLTKMIFMACLLSIYNIANATVISYEVNNVFGNTWEYNYTVENDTLLTDIQEFAVYFEASQISNFVAVSSLISAPAGWESFTAEPVVFSDGFYDAYTLTGGISPGSSLGGFTARFDYIGAGTPAEQFFEIFDADFNILDSGFTELNSGVVAVTAPSLSMNLFIFLFVAIFFGMFRRKQF